MPPLCARTDSRRSGLNERGLGIILSQACHSLKMTRGKLAIALSVALLASLPLFAQGTGGRILRAHCRSQRRSSGHGEGHSDQ